MVLSIRDHFKEFAQNRITGASRHSIILNVNGYTVYCHNKVFGRLMTDSTISFDVQVAPAHKDPRTGIEFPETLWIQAYIPTRF